MKRAFAVSVLLLVALLASGCATNRGVRRMIDENNGLYNQRIGLLAVRVNDLSEAQDAQKENLLSYLKKQNQLLIEFIDQLEEKETPPENTEEPAEPTNAS